MNRDEKTTEKEGNKRGFSEQEFIDYLEERFRKLRLEEQKFREEVLLKQSMDDKSSHISKMEN
ncbi:MAG TPA: hypothetical protein VLB50_01765 [Ignavibacteriaceae bacterium]|nr:hypothetical protein [Ignavibacteriaceae bacterium]